jgi:hypothetical protein
LHWNGTAWSKVKSPNPSSDPPNIPANALSAVSARSASDAWAVGTYDHNGVSDALVLHWNGTSWTQATTPAAPRYTDYGLTGVSAVSGSDAWAVGVQGVPSDGGKSGTLILHWDGTAWSTVASPNPGSGTNLLEGVDATSSSNAWAVGEDTSADAPGRSRTLVLHWNGTAWSAAASPNPGPLTNHLSAVSATSASDAWAVGSYWNSTGLHRSLILHWNGTTWSKTHSPNPGPLTSRLFAVSARTGSDAWAVGDHDTTVSTDTSLIAHWNGTGWTNALAG